MCLDADYGLDATCLEPLLAGEGGLLLGDYSVLSDLQVDLAPVETLLL